MTMALSATVRTATMQAIITAAGASALLDLYTTARPASGAAITTQTLLSSNVCASVLGVAAAGVLTFNAVASAVAAATGTAVWARLTTSAGVFVADFDVGSDVTLNTSSIVAGANVSVTSGSITAGNA